MNTAFRSTLRQLIKTPGFTFTAVATLAICIAANLTIFAVVDAILVRPLPFPSAERLVTLFNTYPGAGVDRSSASIPNYLDRPAIKAFSSVAISQESSNIVGDVGSPVRVPTARVSPEFFSTLGVPLRLGRTFTAANETYGADQVAILTDGFWKTHFNADPKVIGRTFVIDGQTSTVIGVLFPGFHYLSSKAQFYRPAAWGKDEAKVSNRHSNNWDMIARLADGVNPAQAQAQVDAFNALQLKDDPYAQLVKSVGYHTTVSGLRADYVRTVRPMLLLLQCGVLFLLLIGGVNLANLLLIRASSRVKELAVRQALGAGRWHIAADVLRETMLLALAGGGSGILLGAFGIDLLRYLGTDKLPLGGDVAFDGRVAAAALLGSLVVGVVLALPAIWLNLRTKLAAGLQAESRSGTADRGAQRLRHAFIIAQVAVAFDLLSSAGLLSVSLNRLMAAPTGFRADGILAGGLTLPWKGYPDTPARLAFVDRLLPAIRNVAGVSQAALTTGLPFGSDVNDSAISVEGVSEDGSAIRAHFLSSVSSGYWDLMGIPLLKGRLLADADMRSKNRVCVVDQAFAERYWPNTDPIGRRISDGAHFSKDDCLTVVGVVGNAKRSALSETITHGAVYFPISDYGVGGNSFSLAVRTSLPPAALAPVVQKTILQLDPSLPIDDFRSMTARIEDSAVDRRSPAILAGVFAGIALLLAALGTYGVLSYAVAQRQREIGVRMSLGALPVQIRNQFLGLGLRLLVAGTILGIAGAWLSGRAMQSILFQVPAFEGKTLSVTLVVMSAVSLAACLVPALRAARVNPIVALRGD